MVVIIYYNRFYFRIVFSLKFKMTTQIEKCNKLVVIGYGTTVAPQLKIAQKDLFTHLNIEQWNNEMRSANFKKKRINNIERLWYFKRKS